MRNAIWKYRGLSKHGPRVGGVAVLIVASFALATRPGAAPQTQSNGTYTPPAYSRPSLNSDPMADTRPLNAPNPAKVEHMREDERHKRLVSDTARLVELTNELKTEVDKAAKDELSLDVVKKAAEIEKLAHDVKERMKS